MKTFADYVNEAGLGLNAGPQKAKWIIDKKRRGEIILKAGTKMLFRVCKYPDLSEPYSVKMIFSTTRKNPGQLFPTLKTAMAHIDKMFTYGITEKYIVEPMSKDVVDWLEKCTH